MKRFFNLFAFFLLALASYAYDVEVDGIYYNLYSETKEAQVTNNGWWPYSGSYSGSVVIPESITYDGITYNVTSIGGSAFYDCSSLTSVTIPNSVTSIGYDAFEYCSSLTSVTIPNSVTSIGGRAFFDCSSLTSVTIGNSVTSIGYDAFYGCANVKELIYADGCTEVLWTGLNSIESVTIPNSVTSIGGGALSGCSSLTEIHITDLTAWCNILFSGNPFFTHAHHLYMNGEEIKDLVIPEGVTSIGGYAFFYCSGLTSVTIPNSVTSIGEGAFSGCSGLISVTIPNSVTSIEDYAFEDCSSLISMIIPSSVTSIGYGAFRGCSGLTSMIIPSSVTNIESAAFENCSALAAIIIPSSVTSIGYGAFFGCSSLPVIDNIRYADTYLVEAIDKNQAEYKIKEGTRFIGDYAFEDCSSLTALTLPSSVVSIGEVMLLGCDNLTTLTVAPENPIYDSRNSCNAIIDSRSNCLILGCANTIIPNTVVSIGVGAFCSISNLKYINIPNSVKQIGAYAFEECENLETVVMGKNIERIDYRAFDECGIKEIYMHATVPPLYWDEDEDERIDEDHMFDEDVYTSATLYVPKDAVAYYRISDVWKKFKKIQVWENAEQLQTIAVTTSAAGYATFYSSETAYQLPEGLSAQVLTSCSGDKLTYKIIADGSVSGIIPKGTAVMLVNEAKCSDTFTLTASESTVTYSGTNYLNGRDDDGMTTSTTSCNFYKLTYGEGNLSNVFGWYWGADNGAAFSIAGHKAWLALPKSMTSRSTFCIEDVTAILSATTDDAETTHYDLQGRRILTPNASGLYITDGKKVFIKK